ncbi:hypothetical protein CQ018_09385 [Arthrobacter sp. MYb227]|uniref:GerMN domain-containing protein n=1 Tax=Arthrobacter sp. MYb227 TaxID=1848601 RepID=UPI000CFC4754|nr:GerMN domain-containing protein [Arthrobacter sp. MYb227]PQZ93847.1 hypothetical protein CQ018_09385 [Arthrobacter sp. MYb227]
MSRFRRTTKTRVAVLVLISLFGTLAACGVGAEGEQFSMPEAQANISSSLAPLSTIEMESLSTNRLAPVYWLAESDDTVRLYREFVNIAGTGDPIAGAVSHMLSSKPIDPAYFNLWRSSPSVGVSVNSENVITLDIDKKAFGATLDAGLAERSIAQLVYTATAAASNSGILTDGLEPSVRILVEGSSDFLAFGQISLDQNFTRDVKLAAPLWIIDPQWGSKRAAGQVTFHGLSADFSGGEYWEIRRHEPNSEKKAAKLGELVATGKLHPGTPGLDTNEFTFSYQLEPGEYVFSAWGVDAAQGLEVARESKVFTLTK